MLHPIIHEQLTHIMCDVYGCTPKQGAKQATKLIKTLQAAGMDIIRGEWQGPDPGQMKGPLTWESLAQGADEWMQNRGGISPWNPPELQ